MKKIILFLLMFLFCFSTATFAATRVKGHFTKKGTYVKSHYRSSKNSTKHDNYSTKGNSNPYTGKKGTKKL